MYWVLIHGHVNIVRDQDDMHIAEYLKKGNLLLKRFAYSCYIGLFTLQTRLLKNFSEYPVFSFITNLPHMPMLEGEDGTVFCFERKERM